MESKELVGDKRTLPAVAYDWDQGPVYTTQLLVFNLTSDFHGLARKGDDS